MASNPPPTATGLKRVLYVCLGLIFVAFGYVGAILPGIPTTPFLLAASFFFVRSSARLHRWLRKTPYFGHLLRDWDEHRGIRRPVKIFAICMVVTVVSISIAFSSLPVWVKFVIGGCAAIGIATILLVPTARPKEYEGQPEEMQKQKEII
jgi:uncharacterized membrane protein YbaN (DUF454 family)